MKRAAVHRRRTGTPLGRPAGCGWSSSVPVSAVTLLMALLLLLLAAPSPSNFLFAVALPSDEEDSDRKVEEGSPDHQSQSQQPDHQLQQQQQQQPLTIQETVRDYWRRTFDEIRNLDGKPDGGRTTRSSLSSFFRSGASANSSNKPRRRFEGFLSWDRLVQDWKDDIQEYLNSFEEETGDAYPFSTYGKPPPPAATAKNASSIASDIAESFEGAASAAADVASAAAAAAGEAIQSTDEDVVAAAADLDGLVVASASAASGSGGEDGTSTKIISSANLPIPSPALPGEAVLPHTDISDKSKRIWIVTTASLPWRTGTAVNPLLRAAYLSSGRKEAGGSVTLMLPWLERPDDQVSVYGQDNVFESPEDQERYIRDWLRSSANMPEASEELGIAWYIGWHNKIENSVYSMGDITALLPGDEVDICVLEEPEHLNWYRAPGESWTKKFKHVVGILHTNYFQYAMDQPAALVRAPAMKLLCAWMCRAHCHRLIKLSGTLGKMAPEKELVENVHGVRGTFIDVGREVGDRIRTDRESDIIFGSDAEPTLYYIGKLLWSKGLGSLMELLKYAEETAGLKVKVDMYGGGPDKEAAEAQAAKLGLDFPFHGPLDHAELAHTHKIFVNPSTSEVLCTTSAEALAMGKFVILPSHPSNDFFAQFPNCLTYATKEEFVGLLAYALTHAPEPMSEEFSHALSWEAATERLEAAGCIPVEEAELMEKALTSKEASIEIELPPLIEEEGSRIVLADTFRKTRDRYRLFRARLSNEIQQSKVSPVSPIVLPKPIRDRLVSELTKKLDLDIDELLSSPKLRLKLSPAELDKTLLQLHDNISESPSGDLLRLIGGGGAVALQNMYMRRQAQKDMIRKGMPPELFPNLPNLLDDGDVDDILSSSPDGTKEARTPTQWVRWAMKKNIPRDGKTTASAAGGGTPVSGGNSSSRDRTKMNMCSSPQTRHQCQQRQHHSPFSRPPLWPGARPPSSTAPPSFGPRRRALAATLRSHRSTTSLFSLLI